MKVEYTIGQHIEVQMQKPNKGNFPIGRTNTGMVCLIEYGTKGFFEYNSTWECEIKEVKERHLIISPKECLKTAAAEQFELSQKIKNFEKKDIKKEKNKRQYQYKSKAEL